MKDHHFTGLIFGRTRLDVNGDIQPLPHTYPMSVRTFSEEIAVSEFPFLEYVKYFISRNGAYPGGTDYASMEQIDAYVDEIEAVKFKASPFSFASFPPEEEFADQPAIVPLRRVYPAVRRGEFVLKLMMGHGDFPSPLILSNGKLAFRRADVIEFVLLSDRIKYVSHRDSGAFFLKEGISYVFEELEPREYKIRTIEQNLRSLPDWQLSKIYSIVGGGPESEADFVPSKAPRLWNDRTPAEKMRGKGYISPPKFLAAVWEPWLNRGVLSEDHIERLDPDLFMAYKTWLRHKASDRVKTLKPGLTNLQRRVYAITADTPWDEVVRIAVAVAKQAQRDRARSPASKLY